MAFWIFSDNYIVIVHVPTCIVFPFNMKLKILPILSKVEVSSLK